VLDDSFAPSEAAMLRPGAEWSGEPRDQDGAAI
jgi:hypothetical protein